MAAIAVVIRWKRPRGKRHWAKLLLQMGLLTVGVGVLVVCAVFGYFYVSYRHVVDERLKQPIFANTAKIFAAPREVRPGQKFTVRLIANELREAGYSADGASQTSQLGTYSMGGRSITVRPGPESYHSQDSATIRVDSGFVVSIADNHGQPGSPASPLPYQQANREQCGGNGGRIGR